MQRPRRLVEGVGGRCAEIDPALVEPPRAIAAAASIDRPSEVDDLAQSLAILLGGDVESAVRELRLQRQDGEVVISVSDTGPDSSSELSMDKATDQLEAAPTR